jgi:hypothetical protein
MIKKLAVITAVAAAAVLAPVASAFASSGSSNPYAGQTSWSQVAPHGLQGQQVSIPLNSTQRLYALEIVQASYDKGLPPYAAVIALSTALQESKLKNYTSADDYDSLGIFQQRPSCGWGTKAEIENPAYAAKSFLSALQQTDYTKMSDTSAAQTVQHSAYGGRYAQWQGEAAQIVSQISNGEFSV